MLPTQRHHERLSKRPWGPASRSRPYSKILASHNYIPCSASKEGRAFVGRHPRPARCFKQRGTCAMKLTLQTCPSRSAHTNLMYTGHHPRTKHPQTLPLFPCKLLAAFARLLSGLLPICAAIVDLLAYCYRKLLDLICSFSELLFPSHKV